MSEGIVDVLLVEDDPAHVELALRAFRKHRLLNRVQVIRDGEEALDYLFGTGAFAGRDAVDTPRMILLDLKLPKVDGLEVLRRVRADERTKAIPIVILTSSQEERDVVQSYRLGVENYIIKPVDFDKFVEAVSRMSLHWPPLDTPDSQEPNRPPTS
jgi:CheY-like chemotaxis protein